MSHKVYRTLEGLFSAVGTADMLSDVAHFRQFSFFSEAVNDDPRHQLRRLFNLVGYVRLDGFFSNCGSLFGCITHSQNSNISLYATVFHSQPSKTAPCRSAFYGYINPHEIRPNRIEENQSLGLIIRLLLE